jgi:hypothetical protein
MPGTALRRGFWLYVWCVRDFAGAEFLYVGRTGDNSSPFATPVYQRMGQHLGRSKNQNALRRHLEGRGIDLEACSFTLTAHGPIFSEQADMASHLPVRNSVGAMEKALADELKAAGYNVLNEVKWKHPLSADVWNTVRSQFCEAFPKLRLLS